MNLRSQEIVAFFFTYALKKVFSDCIFIKLLVKDYEKISKYQKKF